MSYWDLGKNEEMQVELMKTKWAQCIVRKVRLFFEFSSTKLFQFTTFDVRQKCKNVPQQKHQKLKICIK